MSRAEDEKEFTMESTEALINVARNPVLCSASEVRCPLQDTVDDFLNTAPPFSRIRLLCLRNRLDVSDASVLLPVLNDLVVDAECRTTNGKTCGSFKALNKKVSVITPFFVKDGLD